MRSCAGTALILVEDPPRRHGRALRDKRELAQRRRGRWVQLPSPPCPPFHTAIYHWDGRRWKGGVFDKRGDPFTGYERISSPGENNSKLVAVTDRGPSDVWATGTCSGRCPHGHAFVLHWNGSAWSRVPYPGAQVSSAISPVSADDAWVIGAGVLLHLDGFLHGPGR